jgi:hypothetical protein
MNRAAIMTAVLLLATPLVAQDIDLGLGGDVCSLLNIAAPRGNAPAPPGRGAAPAGARGAPPNAAPVDRLMRLREMLTASNAALSKEQETGLNALVNAEIPVMRQTLQSRIQDIQKAKGEGSTLPSMDELAPEIIRLNDQLLGKIAGAPVLTSDQQRLIGKIYKDQVKSRGGLDAIKLTLEDGGAPFSPEQLEQIQPLFDQQEQARLQLIKESQGQPVDKAKTDQLQRDTLAKVLRLLTPQQRTALLAK